MLLIQHKKMTRKTALKIQHRKIQHKAIQHKKYNMKKQFTNKKIQLEKYRTIILFISINFLNKSKILTSKQKKKKLKKNKSMFHMQKDTTKNTRALKYKNI